MHNQHYILLEIAASSQRAHHAQGPRAGAKEEPRTWRFPAGDEIFCDLLWGAEEHLELSEPNKKEGGATEEVGKC